MPAEMVKVVAEMPWSAQGETTVKPTPMPNAIRTSVMAMLAVAPDKIAPQLDAECTSPIVRFSLLVAMAPSLLAQRKNSRCSPLSTRHRGLGSRFATRHGTKLCAADY